MSKRYFYGLGLLLLSTAAMAQVDTIPVDQEKFPGFKPQFNPDFSLLEKSRKMGRAAALSRPVRVNNAETPYFPAVFNQSGGSCSSASSIGYHLTYELNAYRGTDASKDENLLPTHFTWANYFSPGQGQNGIAAGNGVPNIITYEGRTYSRLFGSQDWRDTDFGWMQGYDKWYSAMFNRTTHSANFPLALNTEEGRELVKNWLWNHCGDESFNTGGCVNVMLGISTAKQAKIPSTPTNMDLGVVGKGYIHYWGTQLDHQMAIVGYDDRIEFDLDENGIAGEVDKDEVGAWIIANSWGQWQNNGFIYCPYACSYTYKNDNGPGGWWTPEVHYIRKDYRPLRTIKVKMEYDRRSEICLSAGISTDLNATEPERMVGFKHFMYAGDGGRGNDTISPMLGRWLTGLNFDPMEFGFDLTDLSAQFDTRRPLKYFFIIETKNTAQGNGKVHSCSVIDYEFDRDGLEVPFDVAAEGVQVANKGGRTMLSCIVPGEPLYAPRNLVSDGSTLSWQAPANTPYKRTGYNIYRNDTLIGQAGADALSAAIEQAEGLYALTAVYDMGDGVTTESEKSNRTLGEPIKLTTRNLALKFNNSGFTIPDVFTNLHSAATIEFWARPTSVINWNWHIGPGWGSFLFHANSNGSISVGWNTGTNQRLNTAANTLPTNKWTHVAIVIRGNNITLYINGKEKGSIAGSPFFGIGTFGSLSVGRVGSQGINGSIDEFRIWNEARTGEQIERFMRTPICNPSSEKSLLAYFDMDQLIPDGDSYRIADRANGHNAVLLGAFGTDIRQELNLSIGLSAGKIDADFAVQEGACFQGLPIQFENKSSVSAVKWEWTVPALDITGLNTPSPQFIFPEIGTFDVTLKVSDAEGNISEKTLPVTITEAPAPNADFAASATEIPTGDRVTFHVTNFAEGCTYEWTIPGAEKEKVYTTNASAVFREAGTFDVTLKVTSGSGQSVTSSRTITVSKTAPKSDFRLTPSVVVKGETVLLEDASKYMPDTWAWDLTSANASIIMNGKNGRIQPKEPGIYTVTQQVSNELGSDVKTQSRGLIVCNADAVTGLNFTGGSEFVEFESPVKGTRQRTFSIEWWMNPSRNTAACHQIGDSEETFLIRTNAMGAMVIYGRGNVFTSIDGVVIPSEWHHYAVSFSSGNIVIWRDGERIQSGSLTSAFAPTMQKFRLSGEGGPMNGIIDELRVWSKSISEERIMTYSNAPIEDIAAAEADGLLLYCPFNQNSGNVTDVTSNANTGVRVNFGPEGDAWSNSLGVFSMSNGKPADVTAEYLTNYKAPFRHTERTVSAGSRFKELETGTAESGWILENTIVNTDKNSTTGFYVDDTYGDNLTVMTFTNNFASALTDHKAYQTMKLPAGKYKLTVTPGNHFDAAGSYLVVNGGQGLPDTDNLASAIAYVPLSANTMGFSLTEETEVSLGFVINMSGAKYLHLSEINLVKLGSFEVAEPVGINNAKGDGTLRTSTAAGRIVLSTSSPVHVTVANTAGTVLFNGQVSGNRTLHVEKGIYVVNGQKVMVP